MRFDENRHKIIRPDWNDWLDRTFPGRMLFVYRHLRHGTTVIARWVRKDLRECDEIFVLDTAIGMTKAVADYLRLLLLLSPDKQRQAALDYVRDKDYADKAGRNAEVEDNQDRIKTLLRKRPWAETPILKAIASPMTP